MTRQTTGQTDNPWVPQPLLLAGPTPAPASKTPTPTGPLAPQRGVPAPDHVDQLDVVDHPQPAALWCVGTHGGSGESTLAALGPGWAAAAHAWPNVPGHDDPCQVVLTARSNAHGLLAAQRATTQWAAGLVPDVQVLGLVIVADAPGRLPRPLRDLAHLVGGGVARTWHVPWVEAWRLGEPVDAATAPRAVSRLLDDLTSLLTPSTTH